MLTIASMSNSNSSKKYSLTDEKPKEHSNADDPPKP
jgi:hypothetical protein